MTGAQRDSDPRHPGPPGGGDPDIAALASRVEELSRRAALEYTTMMEEILRSGSRDARLIEQTLDRLLDFCGHSPILALYRRLCRHYWDIDPAAATRYVEFYREMWDSELLTDQGDTHGY